MLLFLIYSPLFGVWVYYTDILIFCDKIYKLLIFLLNKFIQIKIAK